MNKTTNNNNNINLIEDLYSELYKSIQYIKTKKITGEVISNKQSDKHCYITIKNGDYQLSCIGWSKNYPDIKKGLNVEIIGIKSWDWESFIILIV